VADLAVTQLALPGVVPTFVAATGGGDTITPTAGDSRLLALWVKNGGGSSITVTVDDPTSGSPGAATAFNPDTATTVPNGSERLIPLDPGRFRNPANGQIAITYSGVTTVTVGVVRLP
jgi:hypothetical protein